MMSEGGKVKRGKGWPAARAPTRRRPGGL